MERIWPTAEETRVQIEKEKEELKERIDHLVEIGEHMEYWDNRTRGYLREMNQLFDL